MAVDFDPCVCPYCGQRFDDVETAVGHAVDCAKATAPADIERGDPPRPKPKRYTI